MESGPEIEDVEQARLVWQEAAEDAITHAERLKNLGVHKEVVNRLLEPFMWHTVLFTATSFDHLIRQRVELRGAQEEIRHPATELREALQNSTPTRLAWGEWHIPYLTEVDDVWALDARLKLSAARCARVSYLNHGGESNAEDDFRLANYLIEQEHMSPLEHQAQASLNAAPSNFVGGWHQFRKNYELA